jgi:hypothetical protein
VDSKARSPKQGPGHSGGVSLSRSIDTHNINKILVANSSDLQSVERLLKKFPTTEMESRLVHDSDYKDSLFILKKEVTGSYITFPKNIESFADNLFMISLLKLAVHKGWTIQLSTKDLDVKVFDSAEGAFIAGFIAGSCMKTTGEYISGTTRFSKGVSAFQSFSVEKKYGKVAWLRTGGMDNLMQRLSGMKGFSKDYWGLRGTLAALLKMIDPVEVDNLKTYFLPKTEVMKHIRTKLPYENGGLFRPEEIALLGNGCHEVKVQLDAFLLKLDHPSEEFVKNFTGEYAPIKTAIERADSMIRLLAVNRSKVLFPPGNKKSIKKFRAMNLEDKLSDMATEKPELFSPESLPGIRRNKESNLKEGTPQWKSAVYGEIYNNQVVRDVIDSWYIKFWSEDQD